jgi:hypothetical protein
LKTFAAIYRAPLRRLEGHGRFFAALGADRFRFDALDTGGRGFGALGANRLASLATLGLVLETLVRKKHLLAGGENEFSPALGALQNLVMIFHTLLRGRFRTEQAGCDSQPGEDEAVADARDLHPPAGIEPLWFFRVWLP